MLLADKSKPRFDSLAFLAQGGNGRRLMAFQPKETLFTHGDQADSVFYLQSGRAKVTVVSTEGKEATVTLLSAGEFAGEESLAAVAGLRLSTATAIEACAALKISRGEMISKVHEEPGFADFFMSSCLQRA
jgi:CRP/FNR family cyclic AMP-dependent transcriptional regulator